MSDPNPLSEFQGKGITADLEGRVAALETENKRPIASVGWVESLRVRITDLEAAINDGCGPRLDNRTIERVAELWERNATLEAMLTKQRAVYEALLAYWEWEVASLKTETWDDAELVYNRIIAALRDALK